MSQQCKYCKFELSNAAIDLRGFKTDRKHYCSKCDSDTIIKEYVAGFYDQDSDTFITFMQDIEFELTNTPWQIKTQDKIYSFVVVKDPWNPQLKNYIRAWWFENGIQETTMPYFEPDFSDVPALIKKLNAIAMLT